MSFSKLFIIIGHQLEEEAALLRSNLPEIRLMLILKKRVEL
jgi:hypothetical protein